MDIQQQVKQDISAVVAEWIKGDYLRAGDVFVIGCSTSEVIGEQIGTSGSKEVAEVIFAELSRLKQETGVKLAFQCCEHLNRALVVEQETAASHSLDEVSAIPVANAGGSMATYAYNHMDNPVVVEHIQAKAGMDIGETLIGMHLKHVAVPVRFSEKWVGNARLTAARTRPKLIGGKRAVYENNEANNRCT